MKKHRYLAFVVFAAALLVSMIREWSAPAACPLPRVDQAVSLAAGNSR
jgi:hypothetical protein